MSLKNKYSKLTDKEKKKEILRLYQKEKKSLADVAKELGTYANKIRRDAIKFDIKLRDKSSAQSNALKTGKATHPTEGKQHSDESKNKIGKSLMEVWEGLSDAELKRRSDTAKKLWSALPEQEKEERLRLAREAVRVTSKTGSKMEKYLLSGLIKEGFKVEPHKEQLLGNTRLHLDLFLPTINVAIEVDGLSHFLPVWGEDALAKTKKYDQKKSGLIVGRGYKLIRIAQMHEYSNARAQRVLEQLVSVLNDIGKTKTKIITIED